jgi:hypothetical protein
VLSRRASTSRAEIGFDQPLFSELMRCFHAKRLDGSAPRAIDSVGANGQRDRPADAAIAAVAQAGLGFQRHRFAARRARAQAGMGDFDLGVGADAAGQAQPPFALRRLAADPRALTRQLRLAISRFGDIRLGTQARALGVDRRAGGDAGPGNERTAHGDHRALVQRHCWHPSGAHFVGPVRVSHSGCFEQPVCRCEPLKAFACNLSNTVSMRAA